MSSLRHKTRRLEIRPLEFADFQRWFESHDLAKPKIDRFDWSPVPELWKKRSKK